MKSEGNALVREWVAAVSGPPVVGALEGVYVEAAREIAARGPACWASGRCCHFEKTGHRLYVTGLEAAYTVTRLGSLGHAALTIEGVETAKSAGGCPFLEGNLCTVHTIKPLGCRLYFCDRSAQAWQQELSERLLGEIRGIHERYGVAYRYGEWREMLGMFVGDGAGRGA